MSTYRVIQWVTGHVGSVGLRHFIANPTYQLVGLLVTNPEKVGRDAGVIAEPGPLRSAEPPRRERPAGSA